MCHRCTTKNKFTSRITCLRVRTQAGQVVCAQQFSAGVPSAFFRVTGRTARLFLIILTVPWPKSRGIRLKSGLLPVIRADNLRRSGCIKLPEEFDDNSRPCPWRIPFSDTRGNEAFQRRNTLTCRAESDTGRQNLIPFQLVATLQIPEEINEDGFNLAGFTGIDHISKPMSPLECI